MPSTFFEWVVFLIKDYWLLLLKGTAITMIIALIGTVIGFIIGLGVALVRTIDLHENDSVAKKLTVRVVKWLLGAYIEVFRGTPMIVQAMVIYYGGLSRMLNSIPDLYKGILSAVIIISINTGAYMAEIIRGGIISVDRGQKEGALSIGMTHWQTMTTVIFPQAIRNIMPSIGNEFVVNIKDSSVLNVISVAELYFMSKSAAGTYFRYFEVFFITAIIYFVLTFTTTRILRHIEKKMDGPDSYVICGSQSSSEAEIHVKKEEECVR